MYVRQSIRSTLETSEINNAVYIGLDWQRLYRRRLYCVLITA